MAVIATYFVKLPSAAEMRNPAPELSLAVPEPRTFFNLSLRTALLIVLSVVTLFALLDVIALATLVGSVAGFWFFLLFAFVFLAVDCAGVYAVLRVHPEYLVVFGYGLLAQAALNVLQFIVDLAVFGSGAAFAVVSVIFNLAFVAFVIVSLHPLRNYGLALRSNSNTLPPVVGLTTSSYVPV
ncbi:hypothetical protein HDU84_002231 [Entophlyctis sp. JEL0112]|nr:hypothetical protein HDU84_002231 [Entophlyctis sp. JEL0112]